MSTKRAESRDADFENATAFVIDKPVDLEGLTEDVRTAMDWTERKQISFVAEGDPANASPAAPALVWLVVESGDKPDTNAFKKAVTKHDITAHTDPLVALREKAEKEEDLTSEEVQLVIRRLLLGTRGL